ncbi:MAG: hypothetical protein KC425_04060 [Anaerolineales bacterium]|nr:hypothetical protein [Anaerolineales bacterium]
MTISEPRLRALLRQAEKTAGQGKRAAALTLFRQITEEAPDALAAWQRVAELSPDEAERQAAQARVQALADENPERLTEAAQMRAETAESTPEPVPDPMTEAEAVSAWLEEATARPVRETAVETAAAAPETAVSLELPDLETAHEEELLETVCYRHPNRETALRCYTCGKPICSQCAVKTPVGYRCPDCIREAEEAFFNAKAVDYLIAPLVSLPISLLAGFLLLQLGGGFFFILIIFFVAGLVGGFIGRTAKAAVGRRRGRYLPHVVAVTVVLGGLLPALPALLGLFMGSMGAVVGLLVPGIYTFIASSAAFYQMK